MSGEMEHWHEKQRAISVKTFKGLMYNFHAIGIILAISAGLFSFGCASTPSYYFNGRTKAQFDARSAECANMAASNINQQNTNQGGYYMGQSAAGGGAALGLVGLAMVLLEGGLHDARFDECMRLGGFTKANPSIDAALEAFKSRNYSQAFLMCKEAADANDQTAMTILGLMYEEGLGVAKDDAEAVTWYRKAADQGNVNAKNALKARGL